MPEKIKSLPKDFFERIQDLSFKEIAFEVADAFSGEDIAAEESQKYCL